MKDRKMSYRCRTGRGGSEMIDDHVDTVFEKMCWKFRVDVAGGITNRYDDLKINIAL